MKAVLPPSGELALRDHFRGRRNELRSRVTLDVTLIADAGELAARTIDVSRSGILLQLDESVVANAATLVELTSMLGTWFGSGEIKIRLLARLVRDARLVRVTMGGLGGSAVPLIACRFKKDLSKRQYERLVAAE